jgi:hypothetical protein
MIAQSASTAYRWTSIKIITVAISTIWNQNSVTTLTIPQMKSDGERCLFVSFSIESYCEKMIILGGNIYAHFLLVAFYKIITNKRSIII